MNPFKTINKTTNFIYKFLKIIVMIFFIILTWSKVQNVLALETEKYIYYSYNGTDFQEDLERIQSCYDYIDEKLIPALKEKNVNYIISVDRYYSRGYYYNIMLDIFKPDSGYDSYFISNNYQTSSDGLYLINRIQTLSNNNIKLSPSYQFTSGTSGTPSNTIIPFVDRMVEWINNDYENFDNWETNYWRGLGLTNKQYEWPYDVFGGENYYFIYDSNLPIYYKQKTYDREIFISELKFYKDQTLLTVHENDQYPTYKNFTKSEPTFTYEIKDNNNGSKNIIVTFENMSDEYTAKYSNLTLGITDEVMTINDNKFTFENITLDSIITINIYKNSTNEIVFTDTIDIKNTQIDKKDPYIKINGYNQNNEINNVMYEYINTTSEMKCYYQFADQEEVEESCITQIKKSDTNTFITLKIKENDKIIYQKTINLNFLQNLPQIKFNSYFESINQYQVLIINIFNSQDGDIFEYSTDNQFYQTFTDNPLNLQFYNNTNIYVRVKRNNKIISTGFIEVIYNSFENSNPSGTNDIDDINNIFDLFDSMNNVTHQISIYINNFWSGIAATNLTSYILLIVMGTVIILIISAINRK